MAHQERLRTRRQYLTSTLTAASLATAGCLRLNDSTTSSTGAARPALESGDASTEGELESSEQLALKQTWTREDNTKGVAVQDAVYAGFGYDGDTTVVTALSPVDGQQRWETAVPYQFSLSFAVSPNTVFMTGYVDEDRDQGGSIHAFDRADGTEKWGFTGSRSWFANPTVAPKEGLVFCTALARDDSGDGAVLYAFQTETGAKRWEINLGNGYPFGTAVFDGKVVVSQNGIRAFDVETGAELPAFTDETLPAPGEVVLDETHIYTRTHSALKSYTRTDFRQAWSIKQPEDTEHSRPVVADKTLLLNRPAGIFAFDAQTGEEQWRTETSGEALSPTVESNTVWLSDSLGEIYALDLASGDIQFRSGPANNKSKREVFPQGDVLVVHDWNSIKGYQMQTP